MNCFVSLFFLCYFLFTLVDSDSYVDCFSLFVCFFFCKEGCNASLLVHSANLVVVVAAAARFVCVRFLCVDQREERERIFFAQVFSSQISFNSSWMNGCLEPYSCLCTCFSSCDGGF